MPQTSLDRKQNHTIELLISFTPQNSQAPKESSAGCHWEVVSLPKNQASKYNSYGQCPGLTTCLAYWACAPSFLLVTSSSTLRFQRMHDANLLPCSFS